MLNPDISLSGKTAIITGASRGIGAAATKRLAIAGAKVVLLARSAEDIESIAKTLGDNALAIVCDVSVWSDVEQAIVQAKHHFGAIDILINNAGVIDPVARIENADPEAWSHVIDINLKGPFYVTRAALPHMKNVSL